MPYQFWHSKLTDPPIHVPAIGLQLFVRIPHDTTDENISVIETIKNRGLARLCTVTHKLRSFAFWTGGISMSAMESALLQKQATSSRSPVAPRTHFAIFPTGQRGNWS